MSFLNFLRALFGRKPKPSPVPAPGPTPVPPLESLGTIAVQVLNADGDPVPACVVSLSSGEQETTNADGYVAFDNLAMEPRRVIVHHGLVDHRPYEFEANIARTTFTVRLERRALQNLNVWLLDSASRSVPGASATVSGDTRIADGGGFVNFAVAGPVLAECAASGYESQLVHLPPGDHRVHLARAVARAGARPLVGPLRVEHKLFRDDTGYRRVFFCSWFPALRILRDNPTEFYRQLDAIVAAGYQGFRTFFAVGGWSPYWDGREVAPVTFQKWHHSRETGLHRPASLGAVIQAWPDYDDLLRTLLRECRARGLRIHQAMGDMQIICPDAAGKQRELDLTRRLACICREEGGLEVMALVGDTNEYPQNHYAGSSPESIDQMGRVLRIWKEEIPGVLTTMGSAISEEPQELYASITHGDVCAVHTSRGTPLALKRTHALVHWEGNYRFFPRPFWQGEPMGWGDAVSVDRITDNAYGVALYAMHALTGQASNYFNGPAIHAREPLESTWGFYELTQLFADHLPEDVATWENGSNGRGGIAYWWRGTQFATATFKDWDPSPPRRIDHWALYDGAIVTRGFGTPPKATGLIVGRFSS